jgi:hypothetical protein
LICHDISNNEKSQLRAKATEGLQAFHGSNFTLGANSGSFASLTIGVQELVLPMIAKTDKISDLKKVVEIVLSTLTKYASSWRDDGDDSRDALLDLLQTHLIASFASLEGYLDPHRFPFFMNTIVSVIEAQVVPVLQMQRLAAKASTDELPLSAGFLFDMKNVQAFATLEEKLRVAVYVERVLTTFHYEVSMPVIFFLVGDDSSAVMDVVVPLWKEECKKEMEKMLPGGMAKEL